MDSKQEMSIRDVERSFESLSRALKIAYKMFNKDPLRERAQEAVRKSDDRLFDMVFDMARDEMKISRFDVDERTVAVVRSMVADVLDGEWLPVDDNE